MKVQTKKTILMWMLALTLICVISIFTSCKSDDDNPPSKQDHTSVPLVILDTDIGSSTDDLFSLEMLYYYQQQGRCKLLGVVVNREGEECAACADVMNTYFNSGNVPVGLVRNGIKQPKVWINYKALPDFKNADSTPMFAHSIVDTRRCPTAGNSTAVCSPHSPTTR